MPSKTNTIILCPLHYEAARLRRSGINDLARIECCGPGGAAVGRWMEGVTASSFQHVILAGLAGALTVEMAVGRAYTARSVVTSDGKEWESDWIEAGSKAVRILTVDCSLTSPTQKRNAARHTNADLVDQESATFATVASQFGLRWAVVRGVSDGVTDALPDSIGRWVDEWGSTRPLAVAGAMLRSPGTLSTLLRLRNRSNQAMAAVGDIIRHMLCA